MEIIQEYWIYAVAIIGFLGVIGIEFKKDVKLSPLSSVLNWLGSKMFANTNKTLFAILWSQLENKTEICLSRGYCSESERYCIETLFGEYKRLKGNHGMELRVKEVFSLPLKPSYNRRETDRVDRRRKK